MLEVKETMPVPGVVPDTLVGKLPAPGASEPHVADTNTFDTFELSKTFVTVT